MSTIAFFGATGGCINACLTHTLLNGYNAIALVRSPSKLTAQLLEQPGLTQAILDKHLRIVQGDATDIEAVMATLIVEETSTETKLVSSIVSGIGGSGTVAYTKPSACERINIRVPAIPYIDIPNTHITEQSTRALLSALRRIASERLPSFEAYKAVAPRVTVISTTGIQKGMKDVPVLFRPMYAMMSVPHADKAQMEKLLHAEIERKESLLCGGVVIVRPSFLTGDHVIVSAGKDSDFGKLRVGTENAPEIGYTVPRALVGEWIFKEVVREGGDLWVGEGVLLTT